MHPPLQDDGHLLVHFGAGGGQNEQGMGQSSAKFKIHPTGSLPSAATGTELCSLDPKLTSNI